MKRSCVRFMNYPGVSAGARNIDGMIPNGTERMGRSEGGAAAFLGSYGI